MAGQLEGNYSGRKNKNSPAGRKSLSIVAAFTPDSPIDTPVENKFTPASTNRTTYVIFFLLGVGMLFPWNVFIMCHEYFKTRLLNSSFSHTFSNYFATTFTLSNVLFLTYLNFVDGKPMLRILTSLTLNGLVFCCCSVFTQLSWKDSNLFFLTLALVFVSGSSTAFLQNGTSLCELSALLNCRCFWSGWNVSAYLYSSGLVWARSCCSCRRFI